MLTQIKADLATRIEEVFELPGDGVAASEIENRFEVPKKLEHGDLALPVFFLAKKMKKPPAIIAKELVSPIEKLKINEIVKVEPVGGYLNFHLRVSYLQNVLMKAISDQGAHLGFSKKGRGQKMVIDFSSPNVAKPMSVGHLRATVIGQAISNLARTQGYEVIGLNHLGDWGVQFGKLAWAYQNWKSEYPFKDKPFESLYKLYVRFHQEAENDESYNQKGSQVFRQLEQGDEEIKKLWQMFVDISLVEYQRLWDKLGVKHDLVRGESFYNDRLPQVERELEDKGLLEESEGAMVVRLDKEEMPPCLIRKQDGASLYATRDLASAIYRHNKLKADLNLYVVGMEQSLHFQQVFKVLEKMGYEWAKSCHHIAFGLYRFADLGKISTRKGNVVLLEDVLNRAVSLVEDIIEQKNPDLPNKKKVAEQVGVGAIIFNDLMNDRVKNVEFNWERVLDFEGDSGPYVQYCQVRCRSLIKKYNQEVPDQMALALESEEERELVRLLLSYEDTLALAFDHFKPHLLAGYLLDVCRAFNHFYHKHRILGEDKELEASRMSLVRATQVVLNQGLGVLNIESPEAM